MIDLPVIGAGRFDGGTLMAAPCSSREGVDMSSIFIYIVYGAELKLPQDVHIWSLLAPTNRQ